MADPAQQLTLDNPIFHAGAAMRAMRDSRYRHESHAIAELIDNSIEACASRDDVSRVELLLFEEQQRGAKRQISRVSKLAVTDNGSGMSPETLARALTFGGRDQRPSNRQIGKYGVGLPTASASQCQRVDVWTWQSASEEPWHCYLDVDSVERGETTKIPQPVRQPVPEWLQEQISSEGLDPAQGTVVLWSKIDRIKARSSTIFTRIERDLGRIYRYDLHDGALQIRMAAIRNGVVRPNADRLVKPYDPMFLMEESATSAPWDVEPMFVEYPTRKYFTVNVGGKQEIIEVRYSIAKREAIGNQRALPGTLPHGKDAKRNTGVSILREDRELLLDRSFTGGSGGRQEPRDRWWGCEVRFREGCDELFGVDHNKQMAATFSDIAQELANSDDSDSDVEDEFSEDVGALFEVANHIRGTIRLMRRDIKQMFDERREPRDQGDKESPAAEAESRASQIVAEDVKEEGPVTKTEHEHLELDSEQRQLALEEYFDEQGMEDAKRVAEELIEEDSWFRFVPHELDGHLMFNVRSRGGVIVVGLNTHHPLYEFLRFLEAKDDRWRHRAGVGIRTMLLAWARMESGIERDEHRYEVQDTATRWGRQARAVLDDLNQEVGGNENDSE